MAILGRKAAEPFRVLGLAEADGNYAAQLTKRTELRDIQSAKIRESRALEKAISEDTSREIRPSISELLGDAPGTKALNRRRLAEIKKELSDIDDALKIVEQRITDAHASANRAACEAARPEFTRRIKAMVDAMKSLDAAHRDFDHLCLEMESEGLQFGHLGPKPHFLGGAREDSRRIASYLKEAGYAQ